MEWGRSRTFSACAQIERTLARIEGDPAPLRKGGKIRVKGCHESLTRGAAEKAERPPVGSRVCWGAAGCWVKLKSPEKEIYTGRLKRRGRFSGIIQIERERMRRLVSHYGGSRLHTPTMYPFSGGGETAEEKPLREGILKGGPS